MIGYQRIKQLTKLLVTALVIGLPLVTMAPEVLAAQLLNRSLTLGSSSVSTSTTHQFSFTFPGNSAIGSIVFEYCSSALLTSPCVEPGGLDASQATLQQQTGETGFSVSAKTTNQITLSRTSAATAGEAASYTFAGVVNPNSAGSFYARIQTYASTGGSGIPLDTGVVVSAATAGITLRADVAPFLDFCVGQTIPSGCASASGDFIQLGNFSTTATRSGTSQMAATSNAALGIAITVDGTTMTSGNNTIPALTTLASSTTGVSQFGMNLRANTQPLVGSEPAGTGTLDPTANYDVANKFTFNPGDVIATSSNVAEFRTLTASYIVNIDSNQAVGIYDTTLTYICTATF